VELAGFDDTGGLLPAPNTIVWLLGGEVGAGVFASAEGGNAVKTCWHRVH